MTSEQDETISLKEELEGVTSWQEAFAKNDALLTYEETQWVNHMIENVSNHSRMAYEVSEALEVVLHSYTDLYPDLDHSVEIEEKVGVRKMGEKLLPILSNPRVRFSLFKKFNYFYSNILGLTLLSEVPASLMESWRGLQDTLEEFPRTSIAIIKSRFELDSDFLSFAFVRKMVSWLPIFYFEGTPIDIALLFIKNDSKDVCERLTVAITVSELCEEHWSGEMEFTNDEDGAWWSREQFTNICESLIREIRVKHDLVNLPDAWIIEMYSVASS